MVISRAVDLDVFIHRRIRATHDHNNTLVLAYVKILMYCSIGALYGDDSNLFDDSACLNL